MGTFLFNALSQTLQSFLPGAARPSIFILLTSLSISISIPHQEPLSHTPLDFITMHLFFKAITFLSLASAIIGAPTPPQKPANSSHELPDGLPYPTHEQREVIEQNAHGTLPNGSPPPVISNKGIVNLQLIAFNELFEVAFFNDLIGNITRNVAGYTFSNNTERDIVLRALKAILAVRIPKHPSTWLH